jgi:hypothetical protein
MCARVPLSGEDHSLWRKYYGFTNLSINLDTLCNIYINLTEACHTGDMQKLYILLLLILTKSKM